MILGIIGILITTALIITVFVYTSPQFGGTPSAQSLEKIKNSKHYTGSAFQNEIPTLQSTGFQWRTIPQFFNNANNKTPSTRLPQKQLSSNALKATTNFPKATWFGHSAILLELNHSTIFIDPMLGKVPAPHPLLGSNRFNEELPIVIDSLPDIDLVLISHDHYDHLDYGSIKKLKNKVKLFYVPLGIKAHLTSWGIDDSKIVEFDWWDSQSINGIEFISTPARHFSGRGFKRNTTLWTSWIIKSKTHTIYFSGDSGYGPHFKEIGEKYGPFDFAMMECGQYNEQWSQIHMTPEETVKATLDLNAELLLPIHWGAFKLALHSWDDPIVRAHKKAKELHVNITSPLLGESILIGAEDYPSSTWWQDIPKGKK